MIGLSPIKASLNGKAVYIVGLGKSGMPVYEACKRAGIKTVLWDDNEAQRKAGADAGAEIGDPATLDYSRFALLCLLN